MSEEQKPLCMKVSLGTIDDLGVKLYSGFPAALAELVANAWDADATRVDIDTSNERIVITDDGHGMNRADIQNKYLTVGYRRRSIGEEKTLKHKRKVMGRKGIGRLALFSMAKQIRVYSTKDGEKIGIKLSYPDIEKAIKDDGEYRPEEIDQIDITHGTKIELTEFLYQPRAIQERLKERLSRRFSIIGEKHHFEVFVNKKKISASDRNYFSKIEYLWTFGNKKEGMVIKALCANLKDEDYEHDNHIDERLSGWIGAVYHHSDLKESGENLNNIAIMMRGRLAQEDILHSLGKGDVGVEYLVGEIHADHLDEGEKDIATSGRQRLNENDERYEKIKGDIRKLVTRICSKRHEKKGKKAKEDILSKNEKIEDWYKKLSPDAKKITDRLFKDTASIQDKDKDKEQKRKRNLVCCIVPAVEQMTLRSNLDALKKLSLGDLEKFSELLNYQRDIEAMSYYDITQGRLSVIDQLNDQAQNNALEKIIQEHIYHCLWLLEPSWGPASGGKHDKYMEEIVYKKWHKIDESDEEIEKLRYDILYKKNSRQHVVVELKRSNRKFKYHYELAEQIRGYMDAVSDILKSRNEDDNVEGVIILGDFPKNWNNADNAEKGKQALKAEKIRITTYNEIILQAKNQYEDYLDEQKKVRDKIQMIEDIMKPIKEGE